MKKAPTVIRPARISRAPTSITAAPTTPSSTVEASDRTALAEIVRKTLSRMRRTPAANTSASRGSAW